MERKKNLVCDLKLSTWATSKWFVMARMTHPLQIWLTVYRFVCEQKEDRMNFVLSSGDIVSLSVSLYVCLVIHCALLEVSRLNNILVYVSLHITLDKLKSNTLQTDSLVDRSHLPFSLLESDLKDKDNNTGERLKGNLSFMCTMSFIKF